MNGNSKASLFIEVRSYDMTRLFSILFGGTLCSTILNKITHDIPRLMRALQKKTKKKQVQGVYCFVRSAFGARTRAFSFDNSTVVFAGRRKIYSTSHLAKVLSILIL